MLATGALAAAGVGLALRQARLSVPAARRPLMGLAAAFVFAAQMVNFPVAGGTSGHLIGSVLAAVLLGPSAAVVVLTAVVVVQCFLFSDGGVLALGANIFNMAIVACVGGYGVYRGLRWVLPGQRGVIAAAAFAAWCSTVLAAVSCAGELAMSGIRWSAVLPAMANVHMVIGLGEGLITGLILVAIARARPDLLTAAPAAPGAKPLSGFLGYGLLLALGLTLFVAPFASPWPDGLERVAASLGFASHAGRTPLLAAPLADYRLPGVGSTVGATAWAGAVGALTTFILACLLARVLVPKTTRISHPGESP